MTTTTQIAREKRGFRALWLEFGIAAALLIPILVLWLPFGFNVGFSGDDWFFYLNSRYGVAWAAIDRPFLPLAYLLGYALSPGYFAGFNLMLVILLFARSWLCYAILCRLESGRALAFAAAILTALIPADTGVFYMGALNVYFAWVAYLLALYLLIVYWQRPRLMILVLMWCALIVNLGTYEAAYPLIVVSPLVLLLLNRESLRTWLTTGFRWYLFPVLNGVRILVLGWVYPGAFHYQSGLMQQSPSIGTMLSSLVAIYQRHFLTAWIGSGISPYWAIPLAIGVLAFVLCWWLARCEQPRSPRLYGGFVLAGVGIVGLAVAILLPTSLSTETVRTFFVSSLGAALALAALFRLLARRALPFAFLVGILAAVGCNGLLVQHAGYVENTQAQQGLLLDVAALVPSLPANSALLVMDETPQHELDVTFWNHWHFQNPFLVMYDDPSLAVALCYPDETTPNSSSYCAFRDDHVEVRISPLIVWTSAYDHLVLVRYTADHRFVVQTGLAPYGHSDAYDPQALIDASRPLPEAAQRMFTRAG